MGPISNGDASLRWLGEEAEPTAPHLCLKEEASSDSWPDGPGQAPPGMPSAGQETNALGRDLRGPLKVLMIATVFNLSYRILRCAQAAGAEVYVLGNAGARGLRFSRYCRQFILCDSVIDGERDEALALEINCLARDLAVSMVMPGDAPSTRAIIACRDLIETPCFPLPSLDQFDALNNKWAFGQLCERLGIRHPPTKLLPGAATLARGISSGELKYPMVAKPLSRSGNGGVVILDGADTENRLRTINYKPVLVQTLIRGKDIGASVYVRSGKIEAFVAHWLRRRVYHTFRHDQIYADIAKITGEYTGDGVYNFDMILSPDGSVYYLECNPRFYFKINLTMVAGINFVALGLSKTRALEASSIPDGVEARFPEAALVSLLSRANRLTWNDLAMAGYIVSDPVPYLMEQLNLTI